MMGMRAKLIRIGNSRGLRLPKSLLEQCGFGDEVDLEVQQGRLVVSPLVRPREGWAEAFRTMAAQGDDALLDAGPGLATSWEQEEWEW